MLLVWRFKKQELGATGLASILKLVLLICLTSKSVSLEGLEDFFLDRNSNSEFQLQFKSSLLNFSISFNLS